ncbi:hypothetical protein U9M48_022923 [Paspalum notatum var. saurae]|uniref:FLZ-type domain-containing protein n=1 Tax=Paspalum notatum var. saurae TaxID=547442 RepID=A0AAQ3WUK2_PASNO
MAGLSVVLEPHNNHKRHPAGKPPAQIISKATLAIHGGPKPPPATTTAVMSSFLQSCCLCHRELAEGRDIYMYRGDRAFCSEECRRRQIFMDDDEDAAGAGSTAAGRGSRRVPGGGRVTLY